VIGTRDRQRARVGDVALMDWGVWPLAGDRPTRWRRGRRIAVRLLIHWTSTLFHRGARWPGCTIILLAASGCTKSSFGFTTEILEWPARAIRERVAGRHPNIFFGCSRGWAGCRPKVHWSSDQPSTNSRQSRLRRAANMRHLPTTRTHQVESVSLSSNGPRLPAIGKQVSA